MGPKSSAEVEALPEGGTLTGTYNFGSRAIALGRLPLADRLVLARQARNQEAIASYKEAVRLSPDLKEAHSNLANLLAETYKQCNVYNGNISRVEDVVSVCYSTSRVPDDALLTELQDAGIEVIPIGDSRAPRTVLAATREGYEVAMGI